MPKYGLIACFSPVIKVDIGEHKFNSTVSSKIVSWKMEKRFKIFAIQKVAKTGNIGKKKTPVAGDIHYLRYLSMQKVNLN